MDIVNIFFGINTFTFMLTCVQIQFKCPLREIGKLLSNRLNTMTFKLEIS